MIGKLLKKKIPAMFTYAVKKNADKHVLTYRNIDNINKSINLLCKWD